MALYTRILPAVIYVDMGMKFCLTPSGRDTLSVFKQGTGGIIVPREDLFDYLCVAGNFGRTFPACGSTLSE
jgi:hypothetical protein